MRCLIVVFMVMRKWFNFLKFEKIRTRIGNSSTFLLVLLDHGFKPGFSHIHDNTLKNSNYSGTCRNGVPGTQGFSHPDSPFVPIPRLWRFICVGLGICCIFFYPIFRGSPFPQAPFVEVPLYYLFWLFELFPVFVFLTISTIP